MGITLKLELHSPTPQANMKSLLVVSVLFGAFASIQAIKVSSESKVDSQSQWPYGSGYGMMGHGMMEDCMMCDMYHGCPSWCYGWNYPYQANVVISEKSDNKNAAQPAAKAESNSKWMYPYGYGYQRQCMMCDMYYGCPSWCWNNGWNNGWKYPYQTLPAVSEKSETKTDTKGKWWNGNGYGMMGHGMMEDCMMCDMYHGCPSWCWNNGWNYPYQTLPAISEKSETKTDSKGKWWNGNGYGMMGHGMMEDCMMCDMYHGCPSWCWNNSWNYPYQTLPAVSEKSQTKADSKGKWWNGNGYGMMGHGMMEDCMMCDMYHGCPSWCWNNSWNNGWNYPYQTLPAISEQSENKAASKGQWWNGSGYWGYQRECMMCGMYGCPSWCYRWNPWMRSN